MKINDEHISRAIVTAKRCSFKRFMNGAVIVKDDRIVSMGWAHMSDIRHNSASSIHAEIHALGRARHIDLTGAIPIVAAVSRKSGNVTHGRPCLTCAIAMYSAGIRHVVYTIDYSKFGVLDLSKDLSNLKVYKLHREEIV